MHTKVNLPWIITTKTVPIGWIMKFSRWKTSRQSLIEFNLFTIRIYFGAVRGIKPVNAGKTGMIPISFIRAIICLANSNWAWCQRCDKGPACFCRFPIRCLKHVWIYAYVQFGGRTTILPRKKRRSWKIIIQFRLTKTHSKKNLELLFKISKLFNQINELD